MKTRKLVRRTLLTAAVSTASLIPLLDAEAFGFESASRPSATGIQLVQYQTAPSPQNSTQPNATVTAELKRMFEENGQPMPSMNPRDLPNAQGQQANMVRPTQRPGGQQASMASNGVQQTGMQQAASKPPARTQQPAKKNFLQKFMGKVTGQEKKTAEASVVPPVPPEYKEPAPAPPAGSQNVAQSPGVKPAMQGKQASPQIRSAVAPSSQTGRQDSMASQNRSMPNVTARPASGSQVRPLGNGQQSPLSAKDAPVRAAVASSASGQVRPASQPTQPVPEVPVSKRTVRKQENAVPPQNVTKSPQYVQPGTAPGFMPANQMKSVQTAKPTVQSAVATSQPKPAATKADDGFEVPFNESDMAGDSNDSLDLDSLVTAPQAEPLPAVVDKATALPSVTNDEELNPFAETEPTTAGSEATANPLTGVRLPDSDEDLFGPDLTSPPTTNTALAETPNDERAGELIRDAVSPMNDFENSLPAINLPAVEDLEKTAEASVTIQPDPGFPELDAEDAAEAQRQLTTTPAATALKSLPSAENSEGQEDSIRDADSERLQQVAEQDRRVRQQRLIQSRADQTGFKGFCPVAIRDRRDLIDTKPEFSATFGLQTYTFSSADAKTAFESDPSRYAPAAGGSDVVLLVNSGEEQPGMLDYALWYRDRLYLFRSRETMAMFNQDPLRFANQY